MTEAASPLRCVHGYQIPRTSLLLSGEQFEVDFAEDLIIVNHEPSLQLLPAFWRTHVSHTGPKRLEYLMWAQNS